jgi:anti-sigma regulatory factor (Ser/Thr protein kinase)
MAYTIAQTAGKRAKSGWQILMPTDHDASRGRKSEAGHTSPVVQIVSTLHNDPRLLTGAGVIAGHSAQQAGLSERAQKQLAAATTEACDELLALARPDPTSPPEVNLTASRFPDRVEITVELSVAPANAKAGPRSTRATVRGGRHTDKLLDDRLVDQVQRETRDGRPCIVLVKYSGSVKSKA